MLLEQTDDHIIINRVVAEDKQELIEIEFLARKIWTEHYTPIIGVDQVNYMLDKFQSHEAMTDQLKENYHYFSIHLNAELVGYFSTQPRDNKLFLSKAYISKEHRGKGIFSYAMEYIERLAKDLDSIGIELTVNKYNARSIAVYESKGFQRIKEAVFDIGNGYVMDDYIYLKHI